MTTVTLFDPTAPRLDALPGASTRATLKTLQGAVVGFVDNAKPNFDHLAADLGELLKTKYGAARVITRRKPSASVPAKPEVIEELSKECDVVIAGSGD